MKIVFLLLPVFIFAENGTAEVFDQLNAEYTASIEYKIGRKGKTEYSLESKSSYTIDYKSDSWFADTCIIILDPAQAPVKNLTAYLNGTRLKGRYIFNMPMPEQRIFLDDNRLNVITFPSQIRAGDKVAYGYSQKYDDIALLPIINIPNNYNIKLFSVRFTHPSGIKFNFEFYFPRGELPYKIDTSDPKTTILSFESLRSAANLPYFPFNDIQASVMITIIADNVSISPTTPAGFFGWYSPYFDFTPVLTDTLPENPRSTPDSLSDQLDRLEFLYDYVRNNIRYIADGRDNAGIYPHSPAQILAHKYGDCKDHAYLLYALATAENIPLSLGTVNTEYAPEFQGVHKSLYDHMICRYGGDAQILFLDPTSKYLPFGSIPGYLIGKEVLVIDSSGARIEKINLADTSVNFHIHIRAGLDSLGWGQALLTFGGYIAAYAFEAQEELSGLKLQNRLAEIAGGYLQNITFDEFALIERTAKEISFSSRADLSQFVIVSTGRLYIPPAPFAIAAADILERERDTLPLFFKGPVAAAMHIELVLPGYRAENDSVVFDAGATASYRAVLNNDENGNIEIDYDYRRPQSRFGGLGKEAFMAFYKNYTIAGKAMFMVEEE